MTNILIVGATRGLGASLANNYASQHSTTVYGTTRAATGPSNLNEKIVWIPNIDVAEEGVGRKLVNQLGMLGGVVEWLRGDELHLMSLYVRSLNPIITAGYFATEDFVNGPKWDEQVKMYSSITLRHEKEGGGNYGHHASKSALNMVGKLLSLDLKEHGIIVSILHPGFMRTEMTKGVGFDKYWDDGGAVTPDEAAESLVEWTEKLDISKSGQYWAPRVLEILVPRM
ncbi:oxidoreductase [Botrytis cinerea]